jgi:predicted RNA methylase
MLQRHSDDFLFGFLDTVIVIMAERQEPNSLVVRDEDDNIVVIAEEIPKAVHRGFLVTGLPLDESTMTVTSNHLVRLISDVLVIPKELFQVKLDRTVFRKIRDGAFCIIFHNLQDAVNAWDRIVATLPNADAMFPTTAAIRGRMLPYERTYVLPPCTISVRGMVLKLDALHISRSAGKVRDHFFPWLEYPVRTKIRLDPTATYSMTDLSSSLRIAQIARILARKTDDNDSPFRVGDVFACCGGNTLGFLLSAKSNDRVSAIELDPVRAGMLQHNIDFFPREKNASVLSSCAIYHLAWNCRFPLTTKSYDVVFLDPPWGGPQYNQETDPTAPIFPLINAAADTAEVLGIAGRSASSKDEDDAKTIQLDFTDLIRSLVFGTARHVSSVVMFRVPANEWCLRWMNELVLESVADDDSRWGSHPRERIFPLLFNFGAKTRLLCFVQNQHFCPASGLVTNATLDDLVADIVQFHVGTGYREHKPQYYDFEKKRWIQLKKWKGSKEPKSAVD